MSVLIPCIIAGGSGTRLWPVSRETLPKPFMMLPDGQSLLQKTFLRAASLPGVERVLTVTTRELFFQTQDVYRRENRNSLALDFILEPCARNTGPAIAAAALHCAHHYGSDALLLVLPADHLIRDTAAFFQAVAASMDIASAGWLTTFGIRPDRNETGYGYIQTGDALEVGGHQVTRFVEKPDAATAQTFLDSKQYLWNAGMLCLRVDKLLAELHLHAPTLLDSVARCVGNSRCKQGDGEHLLELDATGFATAPDLSIDYALMEHSRKVAVFPCDLGWSDIGCWQTLRDLSEADGQGNRCNGETVLHDVHGCYIDSPERLVGGVGLDNLIIIDTPDALLVADAARSQEVRVIAQRLKQRQHKTFHHHRSTSHAWGSCTILEEHPAFRIVRLVVRPLAALSVQLHSPCRAQWTVASGIACMTQGSGARVLHSTQSVLIEPGQAHRLSNPGAGDLVIIEVQYGQSLGENDIKRFTDVYGRAREPAFD